MSDTPTAIYVQWSDDGQHIRKWSHEPFDRGTAFVDADELIALRVEVSRLRTYIAVSANNVNIAGSAYDEAIAALDRLVSETKSGARAALTQTKDTTDDA